MVKTKEEQELGLCGVGWRWGASSFAEEEAWELLCEVFSPFLLLTFFSLCLCFSQSLHLSSVLLIDLISLFFSLQGLNLLKKVSAFKEEAQKLEAEGLQKIQLAVVGSEAEGFYWLLKGAVSHTSSSSALPHPKNAILSQPPLSPSCLLRNL